MPKNTDDLKEKTQAQAQAISESFSFGLEKMQAEKILPKFDYTDSRWVAMHNRLNPNNQI